MSVKDKKRITEKIRMLCVFLLTDDTGIFQLKSRCFYIISVFPFRHNAIIFQYRCRLFR